MFFICDRTLDSFRDGAVHRKSRIRAAPLQSHQDSNPNLPASKELATHSRTVFQPFGRLLGLVFRIAKAVLVLIIPGTYFVPGIPFMQSVIALRPWYSLFVSDVLLCLFRAVLIGDN